MNEKTILFFRRVYKRLFHPAVELAPPPCIKHKEEIQNIIRKKIEDGKPLMVARFGSIELTSLENALYIKERRSAWTYISWKGEPNFFHAVQAHGLCNNAGFFPYPDQAAMMKYLDLAVEDMRQVDILGSWRYNELCFKKELEQAIKVDRELMTPLLTENPWTAALKGKRVLVIHPFADTIQAQYKKRENLFPNTEILPEFTLLTLKAVQTQAGTKSQFKNWFEALQWMKDEIDKFDYDICLIGCGAYGFHLAAHCKRQGKQAIHLGGVLQLLFGIKGKRWETENTYLTEHRYIDYYNENWVRPSDNERPEQSNSVEGGCYW